MKIISLLLLLTGTASAQYVKDIGAIRDIIFPIHVEVGLAKYLAKHSDERFTFADFQAISEFIYYPDDHFKHLGFAEGPFGRERFYKEYSPKEMRRFNANIYFYLSSWALKNLKRRWLEQDFDHIRDFHTELRRFLLQFTSNPPPVTYPGRATEFWEYYNGSHQGRAARAKQQHYDYVGDIQKILGECSVNWDFRARVREFFDLVIEMADEGRTDAEILGILESLEKESTVVVHRTEIQSLIARSLRERSHQPWATAPHVFAEFLNVLAGASRTPRTQHMAAQVYIAAAQTLGEMELRAEWKISHAKSLEIIYRRAELDKPTSPATTWLPRLRDARQELTGLLGEARRKAAARGTLRGVEKLFWFGWAEEHRRRKILAIAKKVGGNPKLAVRELFTALHSKPRAPGLHRLSAYTDDGYALRVVDDGNLLLGLTQMEQDLFKRGRLKLKFHRHKTEVLGKSLLSHWEFSPGYHFNDGWGVLTAKPLGLGFEWKIVLDLTQGLEDFIGYVFVSGHYAGALEFSEIGW